MSAESVDRSRAAPARSYRSQLAVLRDILLAARQGTNKTRIIGLANLNIASFDRYVGYCIERGLLEARDGRYRATERAARVQEAIDRVLQKSTELQGALVQLRGFLGALDSVGAVREPALRFPLDLREEVPRSRRTGPATEMISPLPPSDRKPRSGD